MITLTREPLNPQDIYNDLALAGAGSVVVHLGVVKPIVAGKETRGIRFTPLNGLEAEIEAIESTLRENYLVRDILLYRRVGELRIGDIIMMVAVAATNKEDAFGACQEAVNRFKKIRCVQKQELFERDEE